MNFAIDGKQFELGLFDAQAAMERCEHESGMRGTSPTLDLLRCVQSWAAQHWAVKLTPTAAWQLWWSICERIAKARKAQERIADVGAWLHIDASQLSDDQLFGLTANLPRIKAQHSLQAGQFDALDYEGVYQLVLLATGNEKQARDARTQALERFVDSRCGGK